MPVEAVLLARVKIVYCANSLAWVLTIRSTSEAAMHRKEYRIRINNPFAFKNFIPSGPVEALSPGLPISPVTYKFGKPGRIGSRGVIFFCGDQPQALLPLTAPVLGRGVGCTTTPDELRF
jgi:hypothetical protein